MLSPPEAGVDTTWVQIGGWVRPLVILVVVHCNSVGDNTSVETVVKMGLRGPYENGVSGTVVGRILERDERVHT